MDVARAMFEGEVFLQGDSGWGCPSEYCGIRRKMLVFYAAKLFCCSMFCVIVVVVESDGVS